MSTSFGIGCKTYAEFSQSLYFPRASVGALLSKELWATPRTAPLWRLVKVGGTQLSRGLAERISHYDKWPSIPFFRLLIRALRYF